MTIAEVGRSIESKKRIQKQEEQRQASFDYILADLIGRSVSRIYSSSAKLPDIADAYPQLFNTAEIEAKKEEKKVEASVARFKQFAQFHNKKYQQEVGGLKNE